MLHEKKNFIRDERGFAAGEFALWLPVLLLIILGCFEATRYILIHQKLDRAASQVADLVGQSDGMTTAQLTAVYDAAIEQMKPYDLNTQGKIIVSSVFRATGQPNPRVVWQRTHGASIGNSAIGAEGAVADLPNNFTLAEAEDVVAAEVLYQYEPVFFGAFSGMRNLGGEPLFGEIFQAITFRHEAWARPRGANLTTAP
ncbi:MAG TPA: TadE/TadG family type IV pilus assembly protein [Verrucomicrobiae bacterium]|nr:TadE/TadG family type IV pilus assembly protein [Verrucomicrobiae bacterium]